MNQATPQTHPPTVAEFKHVDIVFGSHPEHALKLLDAGKTRQEILEATGSILGAADCNLKIAEGEICVLMGLSGSGKSTLLRCLNGLNKATRGEVLIRDGEQFTELTHCNEQTMRRLRTTRVAMVFQQFALLPWRTVAENVGLGLELRGMSKASRQKIVDEKLELVGLNKWAKKYAHELSGGMQQRVGLARAFATDADILLMDEPFSALDPLIREHLQLELLQLQKTLKKTIVFVSHDLDEAIKLGNHITIMESGRIVQYGEPEQIVLNPSDNYVREFVAHMNPIKVLRGGSLMTHKANLPIKNEALQLDWTGHHLLKLNDQGQPSQVFIEGTPAELVAYSETLGVVKVGLQGRAILMVEPEMRLDKIIQIRQATGRPVLVCKDAKFLGVIGDDEIYKGMLRPSGHTSATAG